MAAETTLFSTGELAGSINERPVVLSVRDLRVHFLLDRSVVRAVDGVSLHIREGETMALVGESGCGKTVSAGAIMRLTRPPGKIISGQVLFHGEDLLTMPASRLREVRGREMAMIFQEPMSSLNPAFTVGWQIAEVIRLHQGCDRKTARQKAVDMLDMVRIPESKKRFDQYPHELSGGMKQRVMIAIALSCRPQLLIADEPTASLDVTIQAQILELMKQLRHETGGTLLLITHSLGVVAEMADRVAVMYAGQVVEVGTVTELFEEARHPYTQGLNRSVAGLEGGASELVVIPGNPPDPSRPLPGCRFEPRCDFRTAECAAKMPSLYSPADGRWVRCFREYPGVGGVWSR